MARYYNTSYYDYFQYLSLPIHFSFFLLVVFLFLIFTWYFNYEHKLEDFLDNFKLFLMLFPVLLLLFVHLLSAADRERVPFYVSLPEKDALHRAGGSPVGVAVLLVFIMFMVNHHSSVREKWFPLFSRR